MSRDYHYCPDIVKSVEQAQQILAIIHHYSRQQDFIPYLQDMQHFYRLVEILTKSRSSLIDLCAALEKRLDNLDERE